MSLASDLLRDLRFASRLLVKDRWFTLMAVVVLALGIGANAAVFSIVNGALLRSLPLPEPEQILFVGTRNAQGGTMGVSLRDFEDWQAATRTLSSLSFVFSGSFPVGNEGLFPYLVAGCYVSANLFRTLGVSPARGRDFTPEEDAPGAALVVMISHALWRQRYSGDPEIVGRPIRIVDTPGTIIGVMPEGVHFPFNADVWLPTGTMPAVFAEAPRQARGYFAVGRLATGVTLEQSRAELRRIGDTLAEQYPDTNRDLWPDPTPFRERMVGSQMARLFWSLMGAVGFVLLIACSNVANLLLARGARRSGEMSVRVALGASRWQIVRQLLVESVLLACLAGGLGLGLAMVGVRWFSAESGNIGLPYWMTFTTDWGTLVFLVVVCLGTGVLFGLAPALHASKTNVHEMLKEGGRTGTGGRRARRWTAGLVVVQVALTVVLLAGAGVMVQSFLTLYRTDIGIDTSQLVTSMMVIPARKYPAPEDRLRFLQRVDEYFASANSIAASTTTVLPFMGGPIQQLEIDGRRVDPDTPLPDVTTVGVGAGYFDALGVSIVRGRAFTAFDGEPGRQSAIVNERLVELFFEGRDPVGRLIRLGRDFAGTQEADWLTIVGLVPNVRQRSNNQEPEPDPVVYLPHRQNGIGLTATVIARSGSDTTQATRLLREGMMVVDPDQALSTPRTMDDVLAQRRWVLRVFTTMFTVFAIVALVLAAVGLYAVTAYAVTQQTRDIGVRMVLGAQSGQVVWLFLQRSLVQLAVGVAIGLAAAVGLGRVLQSFLVQTSASDPTTLVAVVGLLTLVTIVACLGPARRATRLNPLDALRHE